MRIVPCCRVVPEKFPVRAPASAIALGICALLWWAGCSQAPDDGSQKPPEKQTTPSATVGKPAGDAVAAYRSFVDAFNRKDVNAYFGAYKSPVDCFYNRADTPVDFVREKRKVSLDVGSKSRWATERLEVVGEQAVKVLLHEVATTGSGGKDIRGDRRIVMELVNGEWKIAAETDQSASKCLARVWPQQKPEIPSAASRVGLQAEPQTVYEKKGEQSFGEYTVRTFYNEEEMLGKMEILQNGKTVHSMEGGKFKVGLLSDDETLKSLGADLSKINNSLVAMGKDITGDGTHDLVVAEWSGGAHCCATYLVFELGQRLKQIATLSCGDGSEGAFEDVDGNGSLEFITCDSVFSYWPEWLQVSFAESPCPEVILKYDGGKYALARDLMRKPAPSDAEMKALVNRVLENETWKEGNPPPELWQTMLDLIYTGHNNFATKFLDSAWPSRVKGKAHFLAEFRKNLLQSPYGQEFDAVKAE